MIPDNYPFPKDLEPKIIDAFDEDGREMMASARLWSDVLLVFCGLVTGFCLGLVVAWAFR